MSTTPPRRRGRSKGPAAAELPDKLFFKIGEVADIVGVKPHVLRYWEGEFAALKPLKTRGSHRMYRRRDVELAVLVRRLLQDEGFTIAGAKKRLRELERDRVSSEPDPQAVVEVDLRADLLALRSELRQFLQQLDAELAGDGPQPDRQVKATVTASVPSTVPIRVPRR
ncbi:MAG: MerR family transcriptional regulator [Myxococcales bacterium]|nr:MerR family transcriptional regulator [Myxococcales bacterium]